MIVHSGLLRLSTAGHGAVADLTPGVAAVVAASDIAQGVATVFAVGATVAVTTIEHEPGAIADLGAALERLLPAGADYEHNRRNADTNAHAHLRAAIIGPSESVPVVGSELALGTWQQIVLLDFDDRPRDRMVRVHVIGAPAAPESGTDPPGRSTPRSGNP